VSNFRPERILVEQDVLGLPETGRVLARCAGVPQETIATAEHAIKEFHRQGAPSCDPARALLLCRNRGRFLEPCPGTKAPYRCCCYAILNTGTGCPLDCTYCVLQAYLNNPFITLYVNWQDMLGELEQSIALRDGSVVRIGTGEYGDSLALEHLTGFTEWILPFLRTRPGLVLELQTKTAQVEPLLGLAHQGSIVVSWSLNAEPVADSEEAGAAPVAARLAAARRAMEAGYRLVFHFDPVIYYPGWEEGYARTVRLLAEQIPGSAIAWISIGFLRFMPGLKALAQKRFPRTDIFAQEFVPGLDHKMRYPQALRAEMGARLGGWLRQALGDVFIYLCMEHAPVWRRCLGLVPASNAELKQMLDRRVG